MQAQRALLLGMHQLCTHQGWGSGVGGGRARVTLLALPPTQLRDVHPGHTQPRFFHFLGS